MWPSVSGICTQYVFKVHPDAEGITLPFPLWLHLFHRVGVAPFVHPLISWRTLNYFHLLAIVNKAAVNIHILELV